MLTSSLNKTKNVECTISYYCTICLTLLDWHFKWLWQIVKIKNDYDKETDDELSYTISIDDANWVFSTFVFVNMEVIFKRRINVVYGLSFYVNKLVKVFSFHFISYDF